MRLWRRDGWGSAIVEAQLAAYGTECELAEAGDLFGDPAARARIERLNPLGQIPVLELGDGRVLTESAAMTLWLAETAGSDLLVPAPGAAERAEFLSWLVFLVANIYPCFTFADVPARFVAEAEAESYQARVVARMQRLWLQVAAEVRRREGLWVLGSRFTALDLYVAVMVNWKPGRDWFARKAPYLIRIADRVAARPDMAPVFARNFG